MGAVDLLTRLDAAGIRLRADGDRLVVEPRQRLTEELRDAIRANKPELLTAITQAGKPEVFTFAPPSDPENDAEAIEERAAIIAEGCGMGHAQALQEARWHVEREWAWRAFLRNAQHILDAPEGARQELVVLYEAEAARRYGASVAAYMAASIRAWLLGRQG